MAVDIASIQLAGSSQRAAVDPIAGYAYQFDLTILEILAAAPGQIITIEGLEDVDIFGEDESAAVQCKYLSKQKYALVLLRRPILLMLQSFTPEQSWRYVLHVHFSAESEDVPRVLSLDQLKDCLTEHKRKPSPHTVRHFEGFSKATLEAFLASFTIRRGANREEQQASVMAALASALQCAEADAVDLHYGNAQALVMELAMGADVPARQITRQAFLDRLDKKPLLYTRWHRAEVGDVRYVKALGRRFKATRQLQTTRARVIVIDVDAPVSSGALVHRAHLLEYLAHTEYGAGKLTTAQPWTIVLEGSDEQVRQLKKDALRRGIVFNDGAEELEFSPPLFTRGPIVKARNKTRIGEASFELRLVRAQNFEACRDVGFPVDALISVTETDPSRYARSDSATLVHLPGFNDERIIELIGAAK